MISFQVEHEDPSSRARTGQLQTPHGSLQTPAFMPVGTYGAVKGIPARAVEGLSDTVAHEILGQSVLFPVFRSVGRLLGAAFDRMDATAAARTPISA